ncbi:MAG: SHD1 domain-containing protein, partial [Pirellulales bacterium]
PMPPAEEAPMPTTPPQEPVTVEQPVETAPVPIEPVPPAEEPAEEPDSLFNGTEEAAPPATETPATPPPAEETDDLFGEPAESTPPAESQPAEEPAEQPAEESLDLFGEPAETDGEMPAEEQPAEEQPAGEQPEQPAEETPAEEPPAEEEKPAEEEDDIFGASRGIMREPGGLASEVMRTWVDNTGNFSTRGRLVQFLDGHVRLLKDNGRTTTVPLYRLSTSDLEFVHRQASAQQADAFQTAQSPIAMPGLAN